MVGVPGAAVVAILTRAPSSGGKRRIFTALGRPIDPALLTALLLDTVEAAAIPDAVRVVMVEPPHGCDEVRRLLPGIEVLPQRDGSLGDRMSAAMRDLFLHGARAVALVGSDLPDLDPQQLTETFAMLTAQPDTVVLGPATDGGYYLIGSTTVPPLFADIEWGTSAVLAQTLARAERLGVAVHLLAAHRDVDTVADLEQVKASRTRAWVRKSGIIK